MIRFLVVLIALSVAGLAPRASAQAASGLDGETSPYLRLHVDDAVAWRPWGEAALDEARRTNKPILLAIGYFSCRWCHVMQRENYRDPAIGAIINRVFLPILVDREERPDVDAAYMLQAAQLGLPTGWPLTLFLAPGGTVFFGGTYFPKEAVGGATSFPHVLSEVAAAWREDPAALIAEAATAAANLRRAFAARPGTLGPEDVKRAERRLLDLIDVFHGGFGKTSKFPRAAALEALWRTHLRTGEKDFSVAVLAALRAMSEGGLYDHIGGGFFRYTVDPEWRVPHYEKMLNVNAALLALLTEVWRETGEDLFARRARATAAFLLAEMRLDGGAFASALDAESADAAGHKDEGLYYLWSETDIRRLLGGNAEPFLSAFALAPPERKERTGPADPGTVYRLETPIADAGRIEAALARLRSERAHRARPARDDKLLADWNGMAIAALIEAGLAFGESDWITAGARAFADARQRLQGSDGRLRHSWHQGRAGAPATLEGLAQMTRAALTLFEATGDADALEHARAWIAQAVRDHWDNEGGGFFQAAVDAAPRLARLKIALDMPDSSGNAAMIEVLAKLYFLTGEESLRERAEKTLAVMGGGIEAEPLGTASLLNAADTARRGLQVVIVGRRETEDTQALLKRAFAFSLPARALLVVAPGRHLPDNHPAFGKGQVNERATAYICRGTVCSLPVTNVEDFAETARAMRAGF